MGVSERIMDKAMDGGMDGVIDGCPLGTELGRVDGILDGFELDRSLAPHYSRTVGITLGTILIRTDDYQ